MATQAQNQPETTHTFVTDEFSDENLEAYRVFYEEYYADKISTEFTSSEGVVEKTDKTEDEGLGDMIPLVQQYKKTKQQILDDSFDKYISPKKDLKEPQRLVTLRSYRETFKALQDIINQISTTAYGVEKLLVQEIHADFTKLMVDHHMVGCNVRLLLKDNYTQIEKLMKDLETSQEEVKNRPLF